VNLVLAWIRRNPAWAALAGVVTILGGAVAIQTHRLHAEQSAHAKAALEASNLKATADTTREIYRDSLTVIRQRLALQVLQRPDSLDRMLRTQRIALEDLRASITALSARVASTTPVTVDAADVRHGTFDVRDVPYTAHAEVSLPARGLGDIDLHVALDTMPLSLRLGCGPANSDGIRAASAAVTAPSWATVTLSRVEQDPGLCRSPALERASPPCRVLWVARCPSRKAVAVTSLLVGAAGTLLTINALHRE
jgi:hypothetical protein